MLSRPIVHTLADVVSKNGNMLLSVPIRADGTIDEKELAIVEGIGDWMQVNEGAIFATRPWKVFGEGPASGGAGGNVQGFNEGKGKPFSADDIRFTTSKDGKILYAIALGWPEKPLSIASLGKKAGLLTSPIASVSLLGDQGRVSWELTDEALVIQPPSKKEGNIAIAAVYKIELQ